MEPQCAPWQAALGAEERVRGEMTPGSQPQVLEGPGGSRSTQAPSLGGCRRVSLWAQRGQVS